MNSQVPQPDGPLLAVVILSVGAPHELADAVRSILDQGEAVELVVVNSGGGDVASRLPRGHGIRVVTRDAILWPGAARNRGIAATRAPFVAFLASDCVAQPGWVASRLRHHRAGASAVASAVVNAQSDNPAAALSHLLTYVRRDPAIPRQRASLYGVSYARWLFDTYGLFREDLRVGEDTEFHLRFDPADRPVWPPEVRAVHRNPGSFPALLRDRFRRGWRQGHYWPALHRKRLPERIKLQMQVARSGHKLLQPATSNAVKFPRYRALLAILAYELGHRSGKRGGRATRLPETAALSAMMASQWKDAARLTRRLLRRGDTTAMMHLYAVVTAARLDELPAALTLAEAAARAWPGNRQLSVLKGSLLGRAGRLAAAREHWDAHLAVFGPDHAALSGRLAALIRSDQLAEALAAARALDDAFPHSAAGAWGVVDAEMRRVNWNGALHALDGLYRRFGSPVALERKVALLTTLNRLPEAEAAFAELAAIDLPAYLRTARHIARASNNPGLVIALAEQHASTIAADPQLLDTVLNHLNSAGATEAALALIATQPLERQKPLRVTALLSAGRSAEAWALHRTGGFNTRWYAPTTFSALVSAGLGAGDIGGVERLLKKAEASDREAVRTEASFQRRRLASLQMLADETPGAGERGNEPQEESAIAMFEGVRRSHARFHADPTFALDDALEVAAALAEAARQRRPLSLLRLGDGEGNLLPYAPELEPFARSDEHATLRVWWGDAADSIDPSPLRSALAGAIRDADIVGIPDLLRLMRTDKPGLARLPEPAAKNIRGLRAVLDFTASQVSADRLITSCHVHQSLSTWGLWDVLLPRLGPVSLVTCHEELADAMRQRFGMETRTVFLIPPEQKHAARFASQVGGRHYPERFQSLRRELADIEAGEVVLVAAGVLGKIYCQWIKAAGGIGVDIGSAADAWAGYFTRSVDENASYAPIPGAVDGLKRMAGHDPRVAAILGRRDAPDAAAQTNPGMTARRLAG
ncbi:MAG TPA: glycosyltransferase family A protein [Devosia sp.]|nr:glycosyltransferase family A protein [Devosia sp.]